jgi:hypothetical protein
MHSKGENFLLRELNAKKILRFSSIIGIKLLVRGKIKKENNYV